MGELRSPRDDDAVLGGQNPPPVAGAVLGGLQGAKIRLARAGVEQRIAALKDAIKYGQDGLEVVIQALKDESGQVQRAAFLLLQQQKPQPRITEILQEYPPLISAAGVDYTRLQKLLAAANWEEADAETGAIMLSVCDRLTEGWLRISDIENFPCQDLTTIDNLWGIYSQGQFGISAQKHIWQSLGGKPGIFDWEAWGLFGERVGWRKDGYWIYHNHLNFTLNAPSGHLPGWILGKQGMVDGDFLLFGGAVAIFFKGWGSLLSRRDW